MPMSPEMSSPPVVLGGVGTIVNVKIGVQKVRRRITLIPVENDGGAARTQKPLIMFGLVITTHTTLLVIERLIDQIAR
jgi:hypothetical protein